MSFFTIIEIRLDEAGNTLERLPAWSFATRQEAVTRLNNLMSRHNPSGYDTEGDFWWGTAVNGDRMRFLIETKGGQAEGPTQLVDSSNVTTKEWGSVLEPILAEALKLAQADKGNIQVFDRASGCLSIAVQRGFDERFLDVFRSVSAASGCACGRAIRLRKPVTIADVLTDEEYFQYRPAALDGGYRSVTSVPLIADGDNVVGVLSIHRAEPFMRLDDGEILRSVAEFAANAIHRHGNVGIG